MLSTLSNLGGLRNGSILYHQFLKSLVRKPHLFEKGQVLCVQLCSKHPLASSNILGYIGFLIPYILLMAHKNICFFAWGMVIRYSYINCTIGFFPLSIHLCYITFVGIYCCMRNKIIKSNIKAYASVDNLIYKKRKERMKLLNSDKQIRI